ncbi:MULTISPECIES: patatin-like phospholipase family protein [Methylobacterium]|nr:MULTISPECIES: patatin-like phospholipase family protein [Methylobacterium]
MIASTGRSMLVGAVVLALAAAPPVAFARPAGHAAGKHPVEKKQAEKPATQPERVDFTAAESATAWPEGLPGRLRLDGDDPRAFQALIDGAGAAGDPWLVLSGGGENGAFAAGLLAGWSQAGDRPAFGVVTGVSTGALIAPFAFVGPAADPALRANYTEITAADVFELGGNPTAALTDNWPLKDRIDKSVTPDLLKAVAAEHAKGRRLLIATTQVDAERSTVWDMGAIAGLAAGKDAGRYGDKALKLFREIVLASTAIPGVFPPVMIDALGEDGKRFQEMHNDGGAMAPFYLAPAPALVGRTSGVHLPTHSVYLVVNNRLTPEFGIAPRTILGVLGHSMSAAIKAQTRGAIALAQIFAQRSGLDLHVAEIDGRFTKASSAPFDPDYMKALYQHGEGLGRAGTAFTASQVKGDGPLESVKGTATQPTDGLGDSAAAR